MCFTVNSLYWCGCLQAQAASDETKKSDKKQKKKGTPDENPEDFVDPDTPAGQKKLLASQMAKQYNPAAVEKSYRLSCFIPRFNLFSMRIYLSYR